MNEVKEAFKALDRNTRLVILQLQKEMKDLGETRYQLSEIEKQQVLSRVKITEEKLLGKIVDVENQLAPLKEKIRNILKMMEEVTRENRAWLEKKGVNPMKVDLGITIKHLRGSERTRKTLLGLADDLLPVALLEAIPKLIIAAKEDAQDEPRDWTSLKRMLDMVCVQAERDETLLELVKVQRAEFEAWSPDAR